MEVIRENLLRNIRTKGDAEQGFLSFFEARKDTPFPIKRIYYIYDVPVHTQRGMHAHKALQQMIWCPYGEVEITLDDGKEKTRYVLDKPDKALLVLDGYWREMVWKKEGSVLCVAASDYYDEADYIRNYSEFLDYVEEGYWTNEH